MQRDVTSYQFGCGCADRAAHLVGPHFSETNCRLRQRVRHGAPTGARSHALTTSARRRRNISTVRQTNSVPNTSASTLPTCTARSSMCPSGSSLDDRPLVQSSASRDACPKSDLTPVSCPSLSITRSPAGRQSIDAHNAILRTGCDRRMRTEISCQRIDIHRTGNRIRALAKNRETVTSCDQKVCRGDAHPI